MTGMTRGTRVVTRGRGVARGVRWGVTRGVRGKGTRGVRRGVPGARIRPSNRSAHRRGNLCVTTREWGPGGGGGGLIGLTGLIRLSHHEVTWCRPAK